MPADSVSPLSRDKGPVIQMDKFDHRTTSSWGPAAAAKAYRQEQLRLIQAGRVSDAIQMDIDDVRRRYGPKYDDAILEMIDSLPPDW